MTKPPKKIIKASPLLGAFAALLLLMHVLYSMTLSVPTFRSVDEKTYALMTINFARHGSFFISNDFENFKNETLRYTSNFLPTSPKGSLSPQYPPLYPILASPFYTVFKLYGILYMNAGLYALIVFLIYRSSLILFRDEKLSYLSIFIYILATFSWPYSQTLLSHVAATFFLMASFYLVVQRYFTKPQKSGKKRGLPRSALLLAAGVMAGIAIACRLDSVFFLPTLAYPAIFARKKIKFRHLYWGLLGVLPFIIFLSVANHYKFSSWNPLYYGSQYGDSTNISSCFKCYILSALCYGSILLWVFLNRRLSGEFKSYWKRYRGAYWSVVIPGIIYYMIFFNFPSGSQSGPYAVGQMFRVLIFDYNAYSYSLMLERSLLNIMPYLPALFLFWRRKIDFRIELLLIPVLIYGFTFTLLGDHGWITAHPRYYYPILPSLAILSAYLWRHEATKISARILTGLFLLAGAVLVWRYVIGWANHQVYYDRFFVMFPVPTALAVILLTLKQLYRPSLRAKKCLTYAVFFGACWTCVTVFFLDTVALFYTGKRETYLQTEAIAKRMPKNAVVLSLKNGNQSIPFFETLPEGVVGIDRPELEEWVLPQFLKHYFDEGRPVYISASLFEERKMDAMGYEVVPQAELKSGGVAYSRLVRKPELKK